jgi:hypothetical protein
LRANKTVTIASVYCKIRPGERIGCNLLSPPSPSPTPTPPTPTQKHRNEYRDVTYSVQDVRSEVFTAVTMNNVVFWGIETQFVPHRRHITSPLQSSAG